MKFLPWNYAVLFLLMTVSCVEPYDPPVDDTDVNLLVVDGFIDASNGIASVTLTRTLPVESTDAIPSESGGFVAVEDDKGSLFPLLESGNGNYAGPVGSISFDTQYRLLIRTTDQDEYVSEFISLKNTPAIDSVSYSVLPDGVQLAVSTHDPLGESRHFRWKYVETFQYNAEFASIVQFVGDAIAYRPGDQSIYNCWKTDESTNILVGSTERLEESVVSNFPVVFIPAGSIKLSRRYSILVQQQALTEEAYDFWLTLQKSTEGLGGLFDPLPSEVVGNIRNTKNPAKKVLGFFSGSTVREQRIFVERRGLPGHILSYRGNPWCVADTILLADMVNVPRTRLLIDGIYALGGRLIGYTSSAESCIDCRSKGGNTIKPEFWD